MNLLGGALTLIVDATAGYRDMWFNVNPNADHVVRQLVPLDHNRIVFVDKRPEVKPDLVADDRALPLRSGIADRLVCDPPHLIMDHRAALRVLSRYRPDRGEERRILGRAPITPNLVRKYGYWPTRTAWISYLHYVNREFFRVLSPQGALILKIIDGGSHNIIRLRHIRELLTLFTIRQIHRGAHTGPTSNKALYLELTPKTGYLCLR